MKQPARFFPPEIPEELTPMQAWSDDLLAQLEEDEDIEAIRFEGVTFEPLPVHRATFRGCVFERCLFLPGDGTIYDFMDCVFKTCDFAGMTFQRGGFRRVAFRDCRGIGMYMSEAAFRSVTADDCQFSYANLGLASLKAVTFTQCDLSHASFGEATFDTVAFTDSRLSGAELYGTSLSGMDLRSDQIDGIILGDLKELAGAKVSPLQACDLAVLLGVIVE